MRIDAGISLCGRPSGSGSVGDSFRSIASFVVISAGVLAAGCASKPVSIVSQPPGALIKLDNVNIGNAPVAQAFDFKAKPTVVVSATLPGYFKEEVALNKESAMVKRGEVRLILQEDEAFKVTTTSEATNNWLRVQVDNALPADSVWQKLVDSVTGRYSSIEQLDSATGYLRSIPIVRRFKGPKGDFRVRTRFVATISTKLPLVYKFKIEAEYSEAGDWYPYERVFKEDAALIEEIQSRLGVK